MKQPTILTTEAREETVKPQKRLRWWIAWTLFLSTVINYINRQTFSVLAPVITQHFRLSHTELSWVFSAFQISYAGMWLVGGVLLDIIGTRLGLALAVVWWSIVSVLTGLANSLSQLAFFRFLLGIGEGCNWPGANKAVAEWFPARERGVAVAIFDSGSSVGGALAALLVPWVAIALGWRYAFALSGVLGFFWLGLWLRVYYPPSQHPNLTREEKALLDTANLSDKTPSPPAPLTQGGEGGYALNSCPRPFGGEGCAQRRVRGLLSHGTMQSSVIESARGNAIMSARSGAGRWLSLLKDSNTWGIVLGRSLTDPIWWFYVFWLPQYLSDARGFSLKQIAAFAWIPFVAADIGNFTGGFASGFLIKRGMPTLRARKWVCVVSCLPVIAGIPAARTHNAYLALALIAFAVWGYASWSTMGLTFPCDLFPQDVVASVTGLSGLGAGLAGAFFTVAVGKLVDRFSYYPAFFAAATIPLLATAAVLILLRSRRK